MKQRPKSIDGTLRKSFLRVPQVIRECSGINVFGKRIKSLVFSTDLAIIKNVNAGAEIFNVSASVNTPKIVEKIRKSYPDFPIIATGGPTDESIKRTIDAGANAITWTPPSVAELFKDVMNSYRNNIDPH